MEVYKLQSGPGRCLGLERPKSRGFSLFIQCPCAFFSPLGDRASLLTYRFARLTFFLLQKIIARAKEFLFLEFRVNANFP